MSTNEEVNVKIGASTEALNAGMTQAEQTVDKTANSIQASMQKMSSQVTGSIAGMQSQLKSNIAQIGNSIHAVTGVVLAAGAIIAGGKAFKEVINETINWTGAAMKLKREMGGTTEEASYLMTAAKGLGMEVGNVESVIRGFVRSLKSNEQGLKGMGIETVDSNGKTRKMIDIMLDANKVLLGYTIGKDRDIAMMKVYGRAALDNAKFLQINNAVMEEAKRKAEELGLVVGPESVKQFKAFKAANIEVKEVLHSIEIQIGNAVLPIFTQLGAWLGHMGPKTIAIFTGALKGLVSFTEFVGLGMVVLYETVKSIFTRIAIIATTTADIMTKIMAGDFAGAVESGKKGWKDLEKTGEEYLDNITKASQKTQDSLAKLWGLKQVKAAKELPEEGGKQITGGKEEKDKSRLPEWESYLEKKKEAEENFFKDSKISDLEYWQSKAKQQNLSADEQRGIAHKTFQLKGEIAKEELAVDLQNLKDKSEAALAGSMERVNIAKEEAVLIKSKYGEQSKEYAAMLREIDKKTREFEADQVKRKEATLDKEKEISLLRLDMERENNAFLKELSQITAEDEITAELDLEQRKYALQRKNMEDKLSLEKEGSLRHSEILNEMAVSEQSHANTISQINHKLVLEQKKGWVSVFDSIESSFSSAIQGMITGGLTFAKAMNQIITSVLNKFIDMGVMMAFDWVKKQILMTTITTTQNAVRATSDTAAATESMIASKVASVSAAASYSAVAAVAAMASVAAIPLIGWAMAPAIGAETYAMGMGYTALASAAGGYDEIPYDQIVKVHEKEMILPANLSDRIRKMTSPEDRQKPTENRPQSILSTISNAIKTMTVSTNQVLNSQTKVHPLATIGGNFSVPEHQIATLNRTASQPAELSRPEANGNTGNVTHNHNYTINAIDSKSFAKFAKDNGAALAQSIRNQSRNFSGALS